MADMLKTGTLVVIDSQHIDIPPGCTGHIAEARKDDEGYVIYRLKVANPVPLGLGLHRNAAGELWLCDFEVKPVSH